jgi:serine/threonine protein phosphatase PrpC
MAASHFQSATISTGVFLPSLSLCFFNSTHLFSVFCLFVALLSGTSHIKNNSIMGESNSNNVPRDPAVGSNEKDTEKQAGICLDDHDQEDEKSHTFRRRRLSVPKHHLAEKDRDSRPVRKHSHEHDATDDGGARRKKLKTTTSTGASLKKVHHAGHLPPASPKTRSSHPLYHSPFLVEPPDTIEDRASKPAWRHRHFPQEEHHLPFPKAVVGTYSCHGVEPVYDSEYEEENDLEEQETKQTTVAKINQDRGGVAYPYANCNRTALFAAYDGHGQGGELVSQFALHEVQRRLEKHPSYPTDLVKAFKETFIQVDEDLAKEDLIEPLYAGTTACVVLVRDSQMTISNAGDSRAVLARRSKETGKKWQALDLSRDQNPDVPEEQERIEKNGGFVSPPPEPGLSARVWLDGSFSQIGLAMARSIGDHAVAPVGVIAEPEVTFHTIQEEDEFFVLATDGVWEFIESEEAVRIVGERLEKGDGATKACQALIEAAAAKWHEEEGNYRDDITALVVYLKDLWGNTNTANSASSS